MAIVIVRSHVDQEFEPGPYRVLSLIQLRKIVRKIEYWEVTDSGDIPEMLKEGGQELITCTSAKETDILNALLDSTPLREIKLPFPHRPIRRFVWGDVPAHIIVQSIDRDGYFTHLTAMHIHGLTDQLPKTIYFNVEQHATSGGGELSQEGIDRAFRNRCRVSKNEALLDDQRIVRLNSRNTGRLGVEPITLRKDAPPIYVTSIERTLIDATVRPVYSGGVFEVAEAFKAAADVVSVELLAELLHAMDFTYPYHQAIGFYMERAGYDASALELMRKFGMEFDFYLDYAMRRTEYCSNWRLFIPKRF